MEITRELIGKKVMTPGGIGVLVGRMIEFGTATKALVTHAWLKPETPAAVLAYPASDVELIDEATGEQVRDLPSR